MDRITDSERELAKKIGKDAMIMGWDAAIRRTGGELGAPELILRNLLNKVADYNDKADPSGRIHELEDWKVEKRERSDRASNFSARTAFRPST
jgi:hypothetical protein